MARRAADSAPPDRSRGALLERLGQETFDIAVIGGGITGAGIARDAAMRGLSVALVEKGDFASGTSSRSSRLIHGGLRYLRYGHVGLVREALHERGLLLRLAPHLVQPVAFVLPMYEDSRDRPLLLRLGLAGYDLLAGTLGIGRHRGLSRQKLLEEEPTLRGDGLRSGFRYFDAITDDARLTVSVARSALREGAVALNYVEAVGLEKTNERVSGVHYRDVLDGSEGTVRARAVVSAAGPWTDRARSLAGLSAVLRPTKGIHIVVPHERLPVNAVVAFYFGERLLFAVPRNHHTYIGTTDTDWTGDPDDVEAGYDDVRYVLEAANANFQTDLESTDVVAAWAGIRPLIREEGEPSDVSRDYDILGGPPGFYAICGGKLTTFRSMAEGLVDHIIEAEGQSFQTRPRRCRTAREPLPGAVAEFPRYQRTAIAALRDAWDLSEAAATRLVATYGGEHTRLLGLAAREPALLRPLIAGSPVTAAEAAYAAREQMAVTLEDFLRRRTDLMLFGDGESSAMAEETAKVMGKVLGWSRGDTRRQLAQYQDAVGRMMAFRRGAPSAVEAAG